MNSRPHENANKFKFLIFVCKSCKTKQLSTLTGFLLALDNAADRLARAWVARAPSVFLQYKITTNERSKVKQIFFLTLSDTCIILWSLKRLLQWCLLVHVCLVYLCLFYGHQNFRISVFQVILQKYILESLILRRANISASFCICQVVILRIHVKIISSQIKGLYQIRNKSFIFADFQF